MSANYTPKGCWMWGVPHRAAPTATVRAVFAPAAMAGSVADRLLDALAGAHAGALAAAVVLHIAGQVCRGAAWRGVLVAAGPGVARRRVCAWHVCGAGLSGGRSARGGDAVRIALARREIDRATVPALAGTLA